MESMTQTPVMSKEAQATILGAYNAAMARLKAARADGDKDARRAALEDLTVLLWPLVKGRKPTRKLVAGHWLSIPDPLREHHWELAQELRYLDWKPRCEECGDEGCPVCAERAYEDSLD